jgi:hypothetical protein
MDRVRLNDGFSVFTQEETRLVRGTAVLYDFRRVPYAGKLLVPPTVDFERLVVPVYEGRAKIGAANLFYQDGKVIALITFDYATPERLDLMLGRNIYAVPRGAFYVDNQHPKWYIVDFVAIEGVDLTYSHPEEAIGSLVTVTKYDTTEE